MLLSEIIYNIKNLKNGGEQTDDVKLSDRQMEFIVNHFRSFVINNRVNQSKSIELFTQELTDVKLTSTRDFRSMDKQTYIYKSVKPLPVLCESHRGAILDFVGTRDGYLPFQKTSVSSFNLDSLNDYIEATYFLNEGYLYVATRTYRSLREVYVRAPFMSPREAINFDLDEDIVGFDWEYPIGGGSTLQTINKLIMSGEYRWANLLPPDLLNDGIDGDARTAQAQQ